MKQWTAAAITPSHAGQGKAAAPAADGRENLHKTNRQFQALPPTEIKQSYARLKGLKNILQLNYEQDLACLLSLLSDGAGLTLCSHTGVHEGCGVYSFGCFPRGISAAATCSLLAECCTTSLLYPGRGIELSFLVA